MNECIRITDVKCPICNSYYEDCADEVFKGRFILEVCIFCGYVFNVE